VTRLYDNEIVTQIMDTLAPPVGDVFKLL